VYTSPCIEFKLVRLNSNHKGYYSISKNSIKEIIPIPNEAYTTSIIVPDILDIIKWNRSQSSTNQYKLVKYLRALKTSTKLNRYKLGIYSVKLLQSGIKPEELIREIKSLKWPLTFTQLEDQTK
jgi:hypothetical protein